MNVPRLSPEESRGLVGRFPQHTTLVVGDVMIDEYLWGETGRISPEAPVPVVEVRRESFQPGGAANVARNIVSLGGKVELLTVVGADARADDLRSLLADQGIPADGLLEDAERPTTLKTRIVASRQQVVRVDRESRAPLTGDVADRFRQELSQRLQRVDAVIVSDYGKGIVEPGLMEELTAAARARGVLVAVDPKESHFSSYRGVSVVTPNVHEAAGAAGLSIDDDETLEKAGRGLLERLDAECVLITRGPEGMSVFEPERETANIPAMAREVYDVTGAGDTVIAALTLARASEADWRQAAALSNVAAAVVVGKIGTASVTPAELQAAVDNGFPVARTR
ncbi:MAG TPA: D-glycero-beta-D-manno-heptose-7-phosphate kinase [bacterium]|nr:D-glycero-beta-D-manno-heptose-7-phosphate kinase [bacterium]